MVRGATRGDGQTGDDVTHNIRGVWDVPLRLSGRDVPTELEVRGELYITNSDLVAINEKRQAAGEALYANTRNLASGGIKLLDPRESAAAAAAVLCPRRRRYFRAAGEDAHGVLGEALRVGFAADAAREVLPFVRCGGRTLPHVDRASCTSLTSRSTVSC